MNTLGTLLVWCVLQVTLLAVATMIAYFLARRGGASLRSSVVLAGLITATLLVPLTWSPWPRWELPRAAESINEPPVIKDKAIESNSTVPTEENITRINNPSPSLELEPITWRTTWNNFVEALENPESPVSPASPDPALPWSKVVLGLFSAALLVGVARLVGGYWSVRRTIRQARRVRDPQLIEMLDLLRAELSCRTPIELRETHKTATAAASGWRRPVILLPVDWRGWTSEQTRAVLAHELAHVVRRDYLTACIAQILLALHFYHPLWQWLVGRLRLEQELAADALAANITGGREAYLKNLAALALRRSDASIAWPARAFLPSRHTFLRRVEMLRDPKAAVDHSPRLLKVASVTGLLMLGLVIAGIRPGIVEAQTAPEKQATVDSPAEKSEPKAENVTPASVESIAAYIPPTALFVVTLHPQTILDDPAIQPHAEKIKTLFTELGPKGSLGFAVLHMAGVALNNIESVAIGIPHIRTNTSQDSEAMFAIRLTKPIDRAIIAQAAEQSSTTLGGIIYQLPQVEHVLIPDDYTVLISGEKETVSAMLLEGQLRESTSGWVRLLKQLDRPAFSILFNASAVAKELETFDKQRGSQLPPFLTPIMPMLDDIFVAGLGVRLGDKHDVIGYVLAKDGLAVDGKAAERVAETLKAYITLGQNTIRQLKSQSENNPQGQTKVQQFIPMAEKLLESAEIEAEAGIVHLRATFGNTSPILALVLPALEQARKAAQRNQSMNNLKQIAVAFHNYHGVHSFFPPAVIEENGVKRSWRVEILPYLDQKDLYEQYRKNEPWDSAHNKKLLAQMPDVFRDPADDSDPNSTSYYLLTSEHAVTNARPANAPGMERGFDFAPPQAQKDFPTADFRTLFTDEPINVEEGEQGPGMRDITDGTSNTLMIVEASRDVPWTKPEDIPIDPDKLKELKDELGGNHEGGFLAALGDGSVKFISDLLHPTIFKRMISPVDGQPLSLP